MTFSGSLLCPTSSEQFFVLFTSVNIHNQKTKQKTLSVHTTLEFCCVFHIFLLFNLSFKSGSLFIYWAIFRNLLLSIFCCAVCLHFMHISRPMKLYDFPSSPAFIVIAFSENLKLFCLLFSFWEFLKKL